jgi:hypothetical protein
MQYLAVAQMPRRWARSPLGTLFRRAYRLPRAWHAVRQEGSDSVALCGYRYSRELHRTWDQVVLRRCAECQRLVADAESKRDVRSPLWATPSVQEPIAGATAVASEGAPAWGFKPIEPERPTWTGRPVGRNLVRGNDFLRLPH